MYRMYMIIISFWEFIYLEVFLPISAQRHSVTGFFLTSFSKPFLRLYGSLGSSRRSIYHGRYGGGQYATRGWIKSNIRFGERRGGTGGGRGDDSQPAEQGGAGAVPGGTRRGRRCIHQSDTAWNAAHESATSVEHIRRDWEGLSPARRSVISNLCIIYLTWPPRC
jgi:hypothetical protein